MTNEEAIFVLRGLFVQSTVILDGRKWGCDRNEALDMAIEALKDKPIAKCEWIDSKTAKGYVVCSNCNKLTASINRKKYNYCPFCGADVRSGVM